MSTASSSSEALVEQQPQVFLNFRGDQLRKNFISHLEKALKRDGINVYIDKHEMMGKDLEILFRRIKESRIAIAVISSRYTESRWCLDELAKIKECVEAGTLNVFPVFYKVDAKTVREQRGEFGDHLDDLILKNNAAKAQTWKEALRFVAKKMGENVMENSNEGDSVDKIVKEVKKMLDDDITKIPRRREIKEAGPKTTSDESPYLGINTRLGQLKEKLMLESENVTRVIGIVGMPGIGKTTLAKELLNEHRHKFLYTMFLDDVRQKSKTLTHEDLHKTLLWGLWKSNNEGNEGEERVFELESLKSVLKRSKVFIVLDDVSNKEQIDGILGGRKWLKAGSKVVITTSSKSAINDMVHDTYLVPGLSDIDALNCFCYHAFPSSGGYCEPSFMKLATEFVDYSRGHPSVLKLLARELQDHNTDEIYWKDKLGTLASSPSSTIQDVLRIPYDELSVRHKNVFLDIAYFFRFENENYVRSFMDSEAENISEVRDLADKFLINISGGRVEMNDLLYTFAMGLDSQATSGRRLSNYGEIMDVLKTKSEATKVRGIYLDMSKVTKINPLPLDSDTFKTMDNLKYLKFFNSHCHKECETVCKLHYPEGLEFMLQELMYLHWLKFPSKELPQDFDPKNLIDLKLPYSQIEKVWEGEKDTSKLQWLDLNHSSMLHSLSGLSRAVNLQSMNLEGCTGLKTLPELLQNMENLVFLNMRGCTSLESLPDITLVSLKTLILSGCSSFEEFMVIAENLEELYLDATAIKGLPSRIGKLGKLITLKLKDCKKLLSLPDSIGDLKAIQELILSGCSSLASFPNVRQNLKHLKTLLLDGTAIKEMPDIAETSSRPQSGLCGIYGLSSVQRLTLSRNDFTRLPESISYLHHLKFLELKHCKKLVSVPKLPPNLQWLDAQDCVSLEHISIPLDPRFAKTEHLHSTFIFTNCIKLDQVVKNRIVSYARNKIHLLSNAQARYDKGFVLDVSIGICYPGWQVPVWFNHRSVESEFRPKLPRHWIAGGLTGIALCAVVSFKGYRTQNTRLLVSCSGEFEEEDEPLIQFSCVLGGWTENGSYESREIGTCHVFIGYTSCLHLKKRDNSRACVATEALLKFQVTDGTREVPNCTVVKCGFTLVYAPTNVDHSLCTDNCYDATQPTNGDTSSGSSTDHGEKYYQKESGVSSVLCVAPKMGSDEIIEVGPSLAAPLEQMESLLPARMDETRKIGERKKLMSTINGSTSEVRIEEDNNITCLSLFHVFIAQLRLRRERGASC